MRTARIGLVAAMWVLGLAAFAAFAWIVEWKDATPVRVPPGADVPAAVPPDHPLGALTAGAARSIGAAAHDLGAGERSAAAHAIDASVRAAEVGHENSHGTVKEAFAVAVHRLRSAREALHRGRVHDAREELQRSVDSLLPVLGTARELSPGVPPREVWGDYRGAVLIDANGSMIGEVRAVRGNARGPVAVLHVGGANDVLGFLELGGRTTAVPAEHLLWGSRTSIGSVYVALPVEGSDVSELVGTTG